MTNNNKTYGRRTIFTKLFLIFLIDCYCIVICLAQVQLNAPVGQNITLNCTSITDGVRWSKNGINVTDNDKRYHKKTIPFYRNEEPEESELFAGQQKPNYISELKITNVQRNDTGNYTCHKTDENSAIIDEQFYLNAIINPTLSSHSPPTVRKRISESIQFYCVFEVYPLDKFNKSIKWYREDDRLQTPLINRTQILTVSDQKINVTLDINDVSKKDNGTYICSIPETFELLSEPIANVKSFVKWETALLVLDLPQVSIDFVKAVGAGKIFLNWTVNDGNNPVTKYFVQYMKDGQATYTYYSHNIDVRNQSYILDGFDVATKYQLKITASNELGNGPSYTYPQWIKTLDFDPVFVPQVEVKGNTHSTITIGWSPPPPEILEYIQYYELIVSEAGGNFSVIEEAIHLQNSRNLPYMFDNLKTATEYSFKVRACSELTKLCGNWSESVNGTTSDGISSEPLNLIVNCTYFNISGEGIVSVAWDPPAHRNGKILTYTVTLNGIATYRSDNQWKNETYGPKVKSIDEKLNKRTIYDKITPNTNYTVNVWAHTRSKRPGDTATASCTLPRTIPSTIQRVFWGKIQAEADNWVFKLFMPRVSERNGPICGYRIYLVRIGGGNSLPFSRANSNGSNNKNLPAPEDLPILSYHDVHSPNNTVTGAYLVAIIPQEQFKTEIILGDGRHSKYNLTESNLACRNLLNGLIMRRNHRPIITTTTAPTTTSPMVTMEPDPLSPIKTQKEHLDRSGNLTSEASKILNSKNRRKRQLSNNSIPLDDQKGSNVTVPINSGNKNFYEIFDGPLDPNSNYTGFIEVIVNIDDTNKVASTYSDYFEVMNGGPIYDDESETDATTKHLIYLAFAGVILLLIILFTALLILHRYFNKYAAQGDEVISLRDSLSRALCGGRSSHNHRHLIGSSNTKPADIGPISKADLPMAYIQRHKDTDYGFLREYEMLPNRFNDRTTKHSDAKENLYKNRYPDIKAYDQTRVRLAERNATIGSDYINANFVLGYKERKKFICAQGPMDSTVNDFWRLIWEQHLEIIVMLTNLEEYNKAKCAKYWPEKIDDQTKFGDIVVTFVQEQRFSDYLVRNLKVTRRIMNGTVTGNDVTANGSVSGAAINSDDEERRNITQYHYLVWKDFMAPEHPHGIIKFIRQINSVYSVQRGPILIHCSAGVGRTGTLVALDSLMQQLDDEEQVSIFNTVCDMRHQRNFLVQSLKQYIFLYRALLDIAQFGYTDIAAKDLNGTVENLKLRSNDSKEQCKLEIEFERIKSITDEINKTCTVGSGDENRLKNRNELVIPFDRNRVILNPVPSREHSTYINASFIEGYDNTESFIISQDPLEETIPDFWRMVSEQGLNTIVMISEIGDGPRKCPRYWADDEIQYDNILVKYMHSESCPYYTRREFTVTNCKMKDTISVTQFQYNGWPTVEGEVPEVARGMIELVDQAQRHHNNRTNSQDNLSSRGPILVHCCYGTDKSSIFVALCVLVQQLRTERKVDVCTVTRKLRSQRNMILDSYAQYEFLHRAIVNYADLHKLSIDSSSDC